MPFSSDPDPDPDPCSDIRPSPIAGRWYSGNPQQLSQQIDDFLEKATIPVLDDEIIALIAPHAGHQYSGKTAGHAFRTILGKQYDLIVIISPFHAPHSASILTTAHQAYTTPLGTIPIDRNALQELKNLLDKKGFNMVSIRNDGEHSLEIQLPFLQRALKGNFNILPLMVRNQNQSLPKELGLSLAKILQPIKSLIIASTDLSHFHPQSIANALDHEMMKQFSSLSPEGVLSAERNGTGFACGAFGVAAAIWAAKALGANAVEHLHYSTSAEQTGDRSSVVGYGASAIIKRQ
ncbi:MAG: AmmeMemoRadiSam system protein B [Anaerolineaceae bacterium]|nr:AmmeMemoRadiSam system protein B [Anaerolineaceae bacterium]